jgi:hypothetical protein
MDRRTLNAFVVAASLVVVIPALAANPQELPKLDSRSGGNDAYGLNTPRAAGAYDLRPPALRAGTAYRTGLFPVALRLTTPGGSWLGGQGESFQTRARPPVFGWIELLSSPAGRPRGAIFALTAYGRTPSVAATVSGLRSRGAGAAYQPATPVRLAGFAGTQFDGTVVGESHVFVPFSPPAHVATFYPDAFKLDRGEVFRVVVLDVRGKTVVVFVENAALPAEQFPAFLNSAKPHPRLAPARQIGLPTGTKRRRDETLGVRLLARAGRRCHDRGK